MSNRLHLWLLLTVTYAAARLTVRLSAIGAFALTPELLLHIALVPLAQLVVVEAVRALLRRPAWPAS
jgi:hypothetical protein